jgi:hypothetical protein
VSSPRPTRPQSCALLPAVSRRVACRSQGSSSAQATINTKGAIRAKGRSVAQRVRWEPCVIVIGDSTTKFVACATHTAPK